MSIPNIFTLDEDTGTDAPEVSLGQSQSVNDDAGTGLMPYNPPATGTQTFDDGSSIQTFDDGSTLVTSSDGTVSSTNATDLYAPTSPGIGAPNDDGQAVTNNTSTILNTATNAPFAAQPNVLDQYASYTYQLSWYLLTPEQFNELATTTKPNFASWLLLMQSGGAQANTSANGQGGRSPYFTNDFYFDNLILHSLIPGGHTGTASCHNVQTLEFTVTEPNGLTFPNLLTSAVYDYFKQQGITGNEHYANADYCLVIKFWGYDDQGNLVTASGTNTSTVASSTAASAIVTKYYPFTIKSLEFRLVSRAIEYRIQGLAHMYNLQTSSQRGSIPANFELVGTTVSDILEGNGSTGTQVTVDGEGRPGAPSTPSIPQAPSNPAPLSPDSAETAALFNDSTGYQPGYDPAAGWSA